MDAFSARMRGGSRTDGRGRKAWAGRSVEALEERELLSGGMGAGVARRVRGWVWGQSGAGSGDVLVPLRTAGRILRWGVTGIGRGHEQPHIVADSASS